MAKRETRRIKISTAGWLYIALSIGMGFLAITSGNNILYLLESFLLGGLILSGILSEWAVSSIDVQWILKQAIAQKPTQDLLIINNRSRLPLYCLEFGTWKQGKLTNLVFVPEVLPKAKTHTFSNQILLDRGHFKWDAFYIACEFPFGFAKKIRLIYQSRDIPLARRVWPAPLLNDKWRRLETTPEQGGTKASQNVPGSALSEGEIRQLEPGEDYRYVVWTLSAKRGEPFVRTRIHETSQLNLELDLSSLQGLDLEKKISNLANSIYQNTTWKDSNENVRLIIHERKQTKQYFGTQTVLDTLATAGKKM